MRVLWLTAICSLSAVAPVLGQDAPTQPHDTSEVPPSTQGMQAIDVINRYIEVTGGAQAWASLTSIRGMGRIIMPGMPITGRFMVDQTPDAYRQAVDMFQISPAGETHLARQVTVRAGDETWRQQDNGPVTELNAVARADLLRKKYFNPLTSASSRYTSMTIEGTEDVDGQPCLKLALVPVDEHAPLEFRWFDVAEGLQRKIAETPRGGGVTAEVLLSDYRQVGTVTLHHVIRITSVGASVERIFDAMQTNVTIDACVFERPAGEPAGTSDAASGSGS